MTPTATRSLFSHRHWTWWFMVMVLAVVAGVRLHLLDVSLERDEGEYAYMGQLLLQGVPPYELAYNMKFPGTYLGYAVIMACFGETPAGIHLGVMLMTTATAIMLFWLGKKMLDEVAGSITAASYAVMAACPSMLGLSGHATHFCAFFATAGLCLLWQARRKENWLVLAAAGALFGLAVLMKQHVVFISMWAGLSFALEKFFFSREPLRGRLLSVTVLAAGMFLPLALAGLWLWHAGVFGRFWFWSVTYAQHYVSILPWKYVPIVFRENFLAAIALCLPVWLLAAAGLALMWFDERLRGSRLWLLGFCVASAATTCPGFYFRGHYFLAMLPAVALLGGVAASTAGHLWRRRASGSALAYFPAIASALVVLLTMAINRTIWFTLTPAAATRWLYTSNPYPEAETVAGFIRSRLDAGKPIAVIGSEPEIPFLSHRRSATGYIYTFALMEPQPFASHMQTEMIREIETAAPEFIVFANNDLSWLQRPNSDLTIFNWWGSYQTNYTLIGIADVISPTETRYAWDAAALRYGHPHNSGLEVFHRNLGPPAVIPLSH
jgi:4-amino-4-deoxy-L-arabinose transferase-like glycosyltransferase